jgi:nucleoside-diphosphate-sugar epimerase
MDSILITGGAGYLGVPLTRRLLERCSFIVVYDNLLYGQKMDTENPRVSFIRGDVTDKDHLNYAARGMDYVIHLAAIVGIEACEKEPELARNTNIEGTRNAYLAAKNNDAKFLFSSTCSVYGSQKGICTEEAERQPLKVYSETKIAAENCCENAAILRFGTLFGPGETREYLTINSFALQALLGNILEIYAPDSIRPYVHVDDAVSAILLALDAQGTYNVAAENVSKRDIVKEISKHVPSAHYWQFNNHADRDPRNYAVLSEKIRKELGWKPKTSVKEGIERLCNLL